jgi:hypothetical protein
MTLDFTLKSDDKVIIYIGIKWLRRDFPLVVDLLLEYTEYTDDIYICESDKFETLAWDIKIQCIDKLEKEIKEDDEKYKNFTDYIKNITNKLEDNITNKKYKDYYDLLDELHKSSQTERNRVYDMTKSYEYKDKTEVKDGIQAIVDLLLEYKDKENVYYYID